MENFTINDLLVGVKNVGITGHIRPDGDCVGSCLGLYNYIKNTDTSIDVSVFLEKPAVTFNYLSGYENIKTEQPTDVVFDLFIVLDCSSIDRIEPFSTLFDNAKKTVCIDHHISNNSFAEFNKVEPTYSSACEVLYTLLDESKIDKNVAECLYTGIIHDTGVFKYSSTSAQTMTIAGKLMEKGVDFPDIIDNSFYKKSYVQNQVLGRALLESVRFFNGLCIFSVITKKEMEFYGIDGKGLGGVIEQLRLTDGVEVAIFLYEISPMVYKVSLRSKKIVDVAKIAEVFGGGGHVRASGFSMQGTVHDIINNVGQYIKVQFDEAGVVVDD